MADGLVRIEILIDCVNVTFSVNWSRIHNENRANFNETLKIQIALLLFTSKTVKPNELHQYYHDLLTVCKLNLIQFAISTSCFRFTPSHIHSHVLASMACVVAVQRSHRAANSTRWLLMSQWLQRAFKCAIFAQLNVGAWKTVKSAASVILCIWWS